ncbi:MAG TPA: class III signal peptide-containing protein [Methanobacterium sp.]
MRIVDDEVAQTSAELILIFGGIIVIALIALVTYQNYLKGLGNEIHDTELQNTINQINALKNKFQ